MTLHRHLPTAVVAKQLTDETSQASLSLWLDGQGQSHAYDVERVRLALFIGQETIDVIPGDWIVQDPTLPEGFRFYVLPAPEFHAAFYDADPPDTRLLDTAHQIDWEVGGTLAAPGYRGDSIIQGVRAVFANIAARLRNIHHEGNP